MKPIEITVAENIAISREREFVGIGIPLAPGELQEPQNLQLHCDQVEQAFQIETMARWPDASVKWLYLEFFAKIQANTSATYQLVEAQQQADPPNQLSYRIFDDHWLIDTVTAQWRLSTEVLGAPCPLADPLKDGVDKWSTCSLVNCQDTALKPIIEQTTVVRQGPLSLVVNQRGEWVDEGGLCVTTFDVVTTFYAESSQIKWQINCRNPRAASHPGGVWDLGDPGSFFFKEMTLTIPQQANDISLRSSFESQWQVVGNKPVSIYQESSGGEHCLGSVHRNHKGHIPMSHKGYVLSIADETVNCGDRASPTLFNTATGVSAHLSNFWQNFPSALSSNEQGLVLGLFPAQFPDDYELQAGESKTQDVFLHYGANRRDLDWLEQPLTPFLTPQQVRESRHFTWFTGITNDDALTALIGEGLDGENNFFVKREQVDEYGWRNFGEVYADHEADGHVGHNGQVLVSHYNNQYDLLFSMTLASLRTQDKRWHSLARDLSSHISDIDIYNTKLDRSEYSGGLFWHTDHYLDAGLATHRSFSKEQYPDAYDGHNRGGGPGDEHCYSRGLLLHHYLYNDYRAAESCATLGSWLAELHEGSGGILERLYRFKRKELATFKQLLRGPARAVYRYPITRGTANYINTLMDNYHLTGNIALLNQAGAIIAATAHPLEDISERGFDDIENKWSYTIFLVAVGEFLYQKQLIQAIDQDFHFARDTLVHFADWMVDNEHPYLDKREQLEFPNQTWTAQDLRKATVFIYAYWFAASGDDRYLAQANRYCHYVTDQLTNDQTRHYTRILALLMQSHGVQYFGCNPDEIWITRVTERIEHPPQKLQTALGLLMDLGLDLLKRTVRFSMQRELRWLGHRSSKFARFVKK